MKIAYVYDAVYPWVKGGAEKRVWEIARRMAKNHEVHWYGINWWEGDEVIEKEGVHIHGVCDPVELYSEGRRTISEAVYFARNLLTPLMREGFDVVDCQEFPYLPCFSTKIRSFLKRKPWVITWYEFWDEYWYEYLGSLGHFGRCAERLTLKLPDRIVAISDWIKGKLEGVGIKDVAVVPNGVDFDSIRKVEPPSENWDIIYVGRLSEHKNVNLLLESVDKIKESGRNLEVCVIGDGPEREYLESYSEELGVSDSVEFLGFIESHDEVIGHMKSSKVFVLLSTREGFPNTILEANSCGLPSIVIDHPENGSVGVVEDGETGFITDFSADSVAEKIISLLDNDKLREKMSEKARLYGREHDWSVIVDSLESVYEEVIG
ncbi:hypothetical protein AKJ52_00110 [candidate division MSBL1 archaeon SCGC-AAA382C18]|uniref:Glycosyl transferase family 1 domain-containing protein n=1 Tax=candidate division MSBL1 archaeon SCGC-AAA382C18 TaxID=1698281 RepID=A0A133VM40_9EURY|nr:hypothetical protein AKJ52_00110 [candidate division MSBL1 archaeon SCGC-AAA382C18]